MKKNTHTHTGHCQLCDRNQAVRNSSGAMAKHGYTVEWGFFSGTCPGSDGLPYEHSADLIDGAIINIRQQIVDTKKRAAAIRARTDNKGLVSVYYGYESNPNRKGGSIMIECEFTDEKVTSNDYSWNKVKALYVEQYGSKKGQTRDAFDRLSHSHKNAAEAAKAARESQAKSLDGRVSQLKSYESWLVARKAAWVKKDLTPVVAEPSANDLKAGDKVTVDGAVWVIKGHAYSRRTIRPTVEIQFTVEGRTDGRVFSESMGNMTRMLKSGKAVRA